MSRDRSLYLIKLWGYKADLASKQGRIREATRYESFYLNAVSKLKQDYPTKGGYNG